MGGAEEGDEAQGDSGVIPVLILLRNNLHLTRRCLKTVLAQDVTVLPWLMDNGSSDGTPQWAQTQRDVIYTYNSEPMSVAKSWNTGLSYLFKAGHEAVLFLNNDTELRPDTVRHLMADGGGFVTAVGTRDPEKIKPPYIDPDPAKKRNHPDFSAALIRRWVFEKLGGFDENFKMAFYEDNCFHLRMHRAGILAYALELPFLHHGSMTIKNAEPSEVRKIQAQAALNKEYFKKKFGFYAGTPEYYVEFQHSAPVEEVL